MGQNEIKGRHTPGHRCKDCRWVHESDSTAGTSFQGVELCPLHAAAMELLASCKARLAYWDSFTAPGAIGEGCEDAHDVAMMRAAVARAEGACDAKKSDFQPRYVEYARAHGKTPEAMLELDRARWRSDCMASFAEWVQMKWAQFDKITGRHFRVGSGWSTEGHAAFDAWLAADGDPGRVLLSASGVFTIVDKKPHEAK